MLSGDHIGPGHDRVLYFDRCPIKNIFFLPEKRDLKKKNVILHLSVFTKNNKYKYEIFDFNKNSFPVVSMLIAYC